MEDRDRQLIERYLAQDLPLSEKSEFETRLKQNPTFARELDAYEYAMEAVKLAQRDELKRRFRERDRMLDGETKNFNLGKGKMWMMAAVVTGLIILSWWLYHAMQPATANEILITQDSLDIQEIAPVVVSDTTKNKSTVAEKQEPVKPVKEKAEERKKSSEIFADNFDPYMDESMDVAMRASEEGLSALEKFQSHYSFAEFPEAVVSFQQLTEAQQKNDNIRFMYANALLATGKTKEAIPVLTEIIANGKSNYVTESKFYLALAHVKNENYAEAKKLFADYLDDSQPIQKDKASKLLSALN